MITYPKSREGWLTEAIDLLTPLYLANQPLPEVHVSVGWPSTGGLSKKSPRVGECWHPKATKDNTSQIFISPTQDDPVRVLAILAHELVHAINHKNGHNGHGKEFSKIAKPIGLEAPMTSTVPSPELKEHLTSLATLLGPYPHSALNPSERGTPKQTTRLLKAICENSGYTIRVTKKWLDAYGEPTCPCCDEFFTVTEKESV